MGGGKTQGACADLGECVQLNGGEVLNYLWLNEEFYFSFVT